MKVGSLVECVKRGEPNMKIDELGNIMPTVNEIYTVRSFLTHKGRRGIRLEEIINKEHQYDGYYGEVAFGESNFREIQQPMDLSEMLEETLPELVQP